jgi:transcription-repair coupling factor (superfamily II helicase)
MNDTLLRSGLPEAGEIQTLRGLGPAAPLAIAQVAQRHGRPVIVICTGEQQAYRMEREIRFFAGADVPVVHFPDTEILPYDQFSPHQEILSSRVAALYQLPQMRSGILIATADSLVQRLPPRAWLESRSLMLKVGDRLDPLAFRERLVGAGYQSVSEVQAQGEFAVRGAVLDIFPMGSELPYRLDLFDDEIESLRGFDTETQRSSEKVPEIRLLPAREFPTDKGGIETFRARYREYFTGDPVRSRIYADVSKSLMPAGIESWLPLFFERTEQFIDYFPADALIVELGDLDAALAEDWKQIGERFERYSGDIERPLMKPKDLYIAPELMAPSLGTFPRLRIDPGLAEQARFATGPAATKDFLANTKDRVLFVAESPGRAEALTAWLKPQGIEAREFATWPEFAAQSNRYGITIGPLLEGFSIDGMSLVAEAQVFGLTAPQQEQRRRGRVRDPETLLRDLSSLSIGSPVVHVQHGVGRYRGLQKLSAGGIEAEYLVLEYDKGDKLYVPVASLQLVHRYTGADTEHAPLHSLGSDRWDKAQRKAREKAHDVAAELLQIQARRQARPGISMDVGVAEYERFAAGFPFMPTHDQQQAIDAVLMDMAGKRPMDRVICGDVGFGKTEVALRASFAAVQNGRQVCVLVPTTLLAEQHYKNFADRYAGWPVRVGALSRMRSAIEQKQMLSDLLTGKLDIVIGTHRLLQSDIAFAKLGLVIVDEEHRFGVRHKERLKNLRAEVDMLTLTATPIPRTLNMSLSGLRDLSVIATPPSGRLSIKTFVAEWDRGLIYEACLRELRRGGQVYFLHNDVSDMPDFARKIQELVPEGKVRYAHGQMRERELEQVMLDFYHNRFNILVCSTIIESGIDVPNANTMIIDRADTLGLAQLHQLRGRVGRSSHRAYAYLLVPSRRSLSTDARKRLDAIEQMGELGSGFLLATHDLEIRGTGELLGEAQSGQIEEVGFTVYAEMLARAVRAVKAGKLDDAPFGASPIEVELGLAALIPDDYVPDVHARLALYKRIAEADEPALIELKSEMIDRFGKLPAQADNLFALTAFKLGALRLGITKLRAHARGITAEFGAEGKVDPRRIIKLVQTQPKAWKLEGQTRLQNLRDLDDGAKRPEAVREFLAALQGA